MRLVVTLFVATVAAMAGVFAMATDAPPVVAVRAVQGFTVSGTTVDPAGQTVPGVSVELRHENAQARRTVSDAKGAWKFDNVRDGTYEIRAVLAGFRTSILTAEFRGAQSQPIVIRMQIGDVSETVTVTASASRGAESARKAVSPPAAAPMTPPPPGGGTGRGGAYVTGAAGSQALMPRGMIVQDTASYSEINENNFREVADRPLSTFSVDVDTASYANVRRFLNEGRLPPRDAVRVEELINYFKYDYALPRNGAPVAVTTELGAAPWNPKHQLALIGVRAAPIKQEKVAPRNLTFLLDVSGSMSPENRLPLVKKAMQMLVDTLREEDRVGIVVYAGNSGVALKPTAGDRKDVIRRAIEELNAGGSTNGAAGIQLAYEMATDHFVKGGINRVILATDGDFNVGVTSESELVRLIEQKRERGIFLSVLGVGDNNLKDSTMEKLADKGNGNYNYLDSLQEARRVLIAEAGATLVTVAKDVKLQVEFNPRFVAAYRLIGYENRLLRKEDFTNDRKDAGEVGAGHTVTALYELIPPGESVPGAVAPLKYQAQAKPDAAAPSNTTELMNVKVRYKEPTGDTSKELEFPVRSVAPRMTANLGFAAAVAEYGMLLRQSDHRGSATWSQVLSLAREHRGRDEDGYRAEFIRLADLAAALDKRTPTTDPDSRR